MCILALGSKGLNAMLFELSSVEQSATLKHCCAFYSSVYHCHLIVTFLLFFFDTNLQLAHTLISSSCLSFWFPSDESEQHRYHSLVVLPTHQWHIGPITILWHFLCLLKAKYTSGISISFYTGLLFVDTTLTLLKPSLWHTIQCYILWLNILHNSTL